MFCPKCKSEYRDGFTRCMDCDVELVHELASEPFKEPEVTEPRKPNPDLKTVIVYRTGNLVLLAIAKSLLDNAGIMHYESEFAINNFGYGAVFGIYCPIFGPAEISVLEDDAKAARELLKDLSEEAQD